MSSCVLHAAAAPEPRAGRRAWIGLAVLALPTLLLGLDVTILYLALPALSVELGATSVQALWIMDAYGFLIAACLVAMGALGDHVGRRRLLMVGTAAFAAASLMAAFSPNAPMLILARAALGVAGATLMPSTLALISNMFAAPRERALAIGIWATMFALGMALGPLLGGFLLQRFWWGAAFLVAVPVAALVLVAAPRLLPEYRAARGRMPDVAGIVQSLLAMLALVYGIKELGRGGPGWAPLAWMLVGLALGAAFVRRQRRLASPLLDLSLFGHRTFSAALLVLVFGLVAVAGAMLLVSQYLQLIAGLAPLEAGLRLGPPALAMVAAGVGAPLLARRVRPGLVVAGSLALSAAGYLLMGIAGSGASFVVAGFALSYLGLGTIAALGTDLVVGAAPPEQAGAAAALSETAQELGIAIGVALVGSLSNAVYRMQMAGTILPSREADDLRAALLDSLAAATARADRLPPSLLDRAREAFLEGFSVSTLACAALVSALAALAVILLRDVGVGAVPLDATARRPQRR